MEDADVFELTQSHICPISIALGFQQILQFENRDLDTSSTHCGEVLCTPIPSNLYKKEK